MYFFQGGTSFNASPIEIWRTRGNVFSESNFYIPISNNLSIEGRPDAFTIS